MTTTDTTAAASSTLSDAEVDRLAMRTVENYHRDDMSETWLDARSDEPCVVLLRDHGRRWGTSKTKEDHWWLIVDGTAVAYLHTMSHFERETHQQVLCDIEVREGCRGLGYARRIVTAAQGALGDTLWTTGGFTPLGEQAAGDRLPVLPGYTAGAVFRPMLFVADWDNLIPCNPL